MNDENKSFQEIMGEKMEEHKQKLETATVATQSQRMSARTNVMIHWAALGIKPKEIAMKMGIDPRRVSQVLSSQGAKNEVERIQREMFFDKPQEMFKQMLPSAARTVRTLMTNKNEKGSVRLGAAGMVLDRALGKAVQPIEHQGSAIKELLMALDRKNKPVEQRAHSGDGSEPIEAEFKEITKEEPKDEMDSWLDDNL